MDADAAQPARHLAAARPGHVALGRPDAGQLHGRAYALNKSRMVPIAEYSRDCLKALRAETGISYDDRAAGHAAAVPHAEAARRHRWRCGRAQAIRRALRGARPRRLLRGRTGAALTQEKFVGALRLPGDETGDCFLFTNRCARWRRAWACGSAWHRDRRVDRRSAGRSRACVTGAGCCGRPRAAARWAATHPSCSSRWASPARLPGQGLLDHGAHHRCRVRARIHHHGRDAQGGRDAPGGPHPRRRHG